ncbi:MAG TPA: sulfotransferase [Acidimicrobiales bacterium]|nr:sulfotransferase [Acidimicrobiales bacterium]
MSNPSSDSSRLPDFFLAGQPKSGTTALYAMLRRHPDVFMPGLKEPQFLATDLPWRFPQPSYQTRLPSTLEEYLALFADAEPQQRLGEASGAYLFSRTAAAEIAKLNPQARVIIIFREPASFLRSLHLQLIADLQEDERDLRKAMALEPLRDQGRRIPGTAYRPADLRYSEHLRYTDQLVRFHAALPREQVRTYIYDDFRADNLGTVQQIFEFIAVDPAFVPPVLENNKAVAVRSQVLSHNLHRFSVGHGPFSRATKGLVKAIVPERQRRRVLHGVETFAYPPPPPPDEELMHELRLRLRPEVERFSEYIGRDLVALWAYDRL